MNSDSTPDAALAASETVKKAVSLATRWTPKLEDAFLAAFLRVRNVTKAAKIVGVARSGVYGHARYSPEFAQRFQDAKEAICDEVEQTALERAIVGDPSDRGSHVLSIFILKNWRPEVYGETIEHRHTGRDGGPIQVQQMILQLAEARKELSGPGPTIVDSGPALDE
jgi:hypothetical protein